jgi:MtfA peptidase
LHICIFTFAHNMNIIQNVAKRISASANKIVGAFYISEEELKQELEEYRQYIVPHFHYFNELSDPGKERFLQRLFWFKRKKQFHYHGIGPEPQMPVLISACAVQITFGMRKYRMPYFKHIHVLPDQYIYGKNTSTWQGHVSRRQIYLSWKHFMHGYSVQGDRYNVGLHEMAHALVYVNFLGSSFGRDTYFAEQFIQYKQKAENMLPRLKVAPCNLFTGQAAHNYHECWAESVELFFENPVELYQQYPDLYNLVKALLNQDPVNNIKVLRAIE